MENPPRPSLTAGGEIADETAEIEGLTNAAKAFLGTEEAGLEEIQELDDLGFFEVLDTLNTPWGFLDYLD